MGHHSIQHRNGASRCLALPGTRHLPVGRGRASEPAKVLHLPPHAIVTIPFRAPWIRAKPALHRGRLNWVNTRCAAVCLDSPVCSTQASIWQERPVLAPDAAHSIIVYCDRHAGSPGLVQAGHAACGGLPLRLEAAPEAGAVLYDGVTDHSEQEGGVCAPVYPCLVAVKDKSAALHACTAACSLTGLAAVIPHSIASTCQ